MQNGQKHEPVERWIMAKSEFRTDTGWKLHSDGLLESPDGRTVFPTIDPAGKVIGSHSFYLDQTAVVVKSVFKEP